MLYWYSLKAYDINIKVIKFALQSPQIYPKPPKTWALVLACMGCNRSVLSRMRYNLHKSKQGLKKLRLSKFLYDTHSDLGVEDRVTVILLQNHGCCCRGTSLKLFIIFSSLLVYLDISVVDTMWELELFVTHCVFELVFISPDSDLFFKPWPQPGSHATEWTFLF